MQWLRDGLGIIADVAETGPLAESCPDTEGVYLVPAFTGLGSPWWDPWARGALVGITRGTGRAHLARAVVESMAYQTRDVVDAMSEASGHRVELLRADGGAVGHGPAPAAPGRSAPGAGGPTGQPGDHRSRRRLPGRPREGVWSGLDDVTQAWQLDAQFEPEAPQEAADAKHAMWLRAVERSRGWALET